MQILNVVLFLVVSNLTTVSLNHTVDSEDTMTIIIKNGKALLVDVDESGKVIKQYMEVPEYFESDKNHDEKVMAAMRKYELLKKHQIDQIRFIAFDNTFSELSETAVAHLHDVANHYRQTYANQVIITAAKRAGNNELLEKMVSDVKFILNALDVNSEDIEVKYKNDKGDEPMQFVKVQSNLK